MYAYVCIYICNICILVYIYRYTLVIYTHIYMYTHTELERRRIQVASPLRQVRVAATNIMPGRRVTANDIVYTFFLFDTDVQRHVVCVCACHVCVPAMWCVCVSVRERVCVAHSVGLLQSVCLVCPSLSRVLPFLVYHFLSCTHAQNHAHTRAQ